MRCFRKKKMLTPRGTRERLFNGRSLEPEVEKTRARDLDFLAPLAHVQLRDHVGGKLARVHLALLGQRHERVGLVIAELRIGAGAHENRGQVCVGQERGDGGLQTLFEKVM